MRFVFYTANVSIHCLFDKQKMTFLIVYLYNDTRFIRSIYDPSEAITFAHLSGSFIDAL